LLKLFSGTKTIDSHCNLAKPAKNIHILTTRHKNSPGALVSTLEVLANYGINVEEMRTVMLEGRQAGVTTMTVTEGNIHNIKEIVCEEILKSDKVLAVDIHP
jgi:prephenate dehydratase